ncbi:restriction endonuclease subunit S [Aquabacterium lacunae]|uniref:Restriction endonuclease subunit S n=1 Tax=Aquabacterium lacunae TaxID=2528630 RepID=A0A4Q9H2K3_9BURK|nr:restriction endonuclease subunit S [Aquabacterium lacunae]TBO34443.1 restriction endonuclease subunit S [Aquabacterium lacunae]
MSFSRYPEYKDSGVAWLGAVPSHWSVKRLRRVVQLNPSKSETAALSRSSEVTFLPMEAIGEDGSLALDRLRPIGELESGYTYFAEGDVAIAKITPCFENGKGAVMRGLHGGLGFGTTELIVARPLSMHLDSGYLHRIFTARPFMQQGEASMYGAGGQKRVPDDFVRDFVIALPPVDEQVVIKAFLDRETAKIDALVAEQEQLITLLKEKRQAVISHAVTKGLDPSVPMKDSGVEWLGEVPEHWQVNRLQRVVKPGTSVTYGIVQAGPDVEDGIPYIRTSDMAGDELPLDGYPKTSPEIDASYARSKVSAGDLVIAIRATVGKCLPVPKELDGANLTQGTARIAPGLETDPGYLLAFINGNGAQTYFDRMAKGATFREITLEVLRKTPVLVPPLDEQFQISSWVKQQSEQFLALIREAEQTQVLLKERRSALISAAVTGQIDVRSLESPHAA